MKTPNEMRMEILGKAADDADFRAKLLNDPNAAIADELGVTLPDGFKVEVHEEGADVAHLVLPPNAALDEQTLAQAHGADMWDGVRYSLGIKSGS